MESLAQVGVQLLLFTLGLEFSLQKLKAVRSVALIGVLHHLLSHARNMWVLSSCSLWLCQSLRLRNFNSALRVLTLHAVCTLHFHCLQQVQCCLCIYVMHYFLVLQLNDTVLNTQDGIKSVPNISDYTDMPADFVRCCAPTAEPFTASFLCNL